MLSLTVCDVHSVCNATHNGEEMKTTQIHHGANAHTQSISPTILAFQSFGLLFVCNCLFDLKFNISNSVSNALDAMVFSSSDASVLFSSPCVMIYRHVQLFSDRHIPNSWQSQLDFSICTILFIHKYCRISRIVNAMNVFVHYGIPLCFD